MRGAMLFAAGLFAGLALQVMTAQSTNKNANSGIVMMNHVGISVPNIAEAVTYYTQKMGTVKRSGSMTRRGSRGWSTCRSARTHFSNSTR